MAQVSAICCSAARADASLPAAERDALAERYAARAVQWLAVAKAQGVFENPNNVKKTQTEPDLAVLRDRADYRQLLP